jgi:NADPH:quinone reductase-like Zn-dependent oxidoreductase
VGADEAIDYTREDPGAVIRGMDVVLDLVGGDTAVRSLPALRDGGILIGVSSGTATAKAAAGRRVRVTYLLVEPDHRGLEAIAALFDAGRLAVHVSQTFPLAHAADAHRVGESGTVRAKLVLTVGS